MGDEDFKCFFARISRLETTMRAVGIKKSESDIVQIILRQLPERYNIVKIMTLADPQLTLSRLENTMRSAYSQRKAHEIAKQYVCAGGTPLPPCSCRRPRFSGRGDRGRRRPTKGQRYGISRRWYASAAAAAKATLASRRWHASAQKQLQQHWPRDGGMPRQQQLQQHWPNDGGMPRQQQQQQQ